MSERDFLDEVIEIVSGGDAEEFYVTLSEALNEVPREARKRMRELMALAYIAGCISSLEANRNQELE